MSNTAKTTVAVLVALLTLSTVSFAQFAGMPQSPAPQPTTLEGFVLINPTTPPSWPPTTLMVPSPLLPGEPLSGSQMIGAASTEAPSIVAVTNGASFMQTGRLVPGGIYTLWGARMGGNTSVVVGGVSATVYYSSETQTNFQVPTVFISDGSPIDVQAMKNGLASNKLYVAMEAADPALYGCGAMGAIVQQYPSYQLVGGCGGAVQMGQGGMPGAYLILYANALGSAGQKPSCTAAMDGATIPVLYCGLVSGSNSQWQINLQIPANTAPGNKSISVQSNGALVGNFTVTVF